MPAMTQMFLGNNQRSALRSLRGSQAAHDQTSAGLKALTNYLLNEDPGKYNKILHVMSESESSGLFGKKKGNFFAKCYLRTSETHKIWCSELRVAFKISCPQPRFSMCSEHCRGIVVRRRGLEIVQEDLELFKRLKAQSKNISDSDAIKSFMKQKKSDSKNQAASSWLRWRRLMMDNRLRLIWRVSDFLRLLLF